MLDHLDNILRDLLLGQVAGLSDEAQVRFQPPDVSWRDYMTNLSVDGQPANALNVYLVDLRENRKLRSNQRVSSVENGQVLNEPASARVDCQYLISAWSPALVTPAVEPTLDEHELLYQALGALINAAPLNPSRIYPPGSLALAAVPELIRNADLPTQVAPVEGFPKLAEFWGTMGADHRWRPVVYLIVTLPVVLQREFAGPMVTTRITEYRQTGVPETAEVWIQIGGHVLDATVAPPVPLGEAWVRLEQTDGTPVQTTTTNDLGRFTFLGVRPGTYQLNWRAQGQPVPAAPRVIDVPSFSGEYDLRFE